MKTILALVLGVSLFVSPLAIAGELGSTDSNFLFKNKVAAKTLSAKEMQETQGQKSSSISISIGGKNHCNRNVIGVCV